MILGSDDCFELLVQYPRQTIKKKKTHERIPIGFDLHSICKETNAKYLESRKSR